MSDYIRIGRVWTQEGTFVGEDDVSRQIVRVEFEMDLAQANRLAAAKRARLGSNPDLLADDARELARPILNGLIDNGYGTEG